MTLWFMITLLLGFIFSIIINLHHLYGNKIGGFILIWTTMYIDVYWSIIWAIFLIITRVLHGGRVISGDLCTEEEVCDHTEGYMGWTG